MKKTNRLLAMLGVTSMLIVSACGNTADRQDAAAATGPATGTTKTITVGITNAPGSLNPINTSDTAASAIASILFEPLLELDENMKFIPRLADSIETDDNQNFTAKLNANAKWSDGEAFTANDVLFTFQMIGNPDAANALSMWTSILEGFDDNGLLPAGQTAIAGVEVVDDHTVVFHTKSKMDPNLFYEHIGRNIRYLPQHALKSEDPAKLQESPFMTQLNVSSGAFSLVDYKKDQYVELKANPDYYRGAPKINTLYFKIMPAANLVAQLQTGEIDMNAPGIGNISVQDFATVKNMKNISVKSGKPFNYQMIFFNTRTIKDSKVRQALVYAMDRQSIVDNLLQGEGEVMDMPYTSVHPYADPGIEKYAFDPDKAKALLTEAGWDSGTTLQISVPSGNKTREQAADMIVQNLKNVGVSAQANKYDMPTLIENGKKGKFDISFLGLTFDLDPDISFYLQTGSTWNWSGYSNPEMDTLLKQGVEEVEPEKRKAIYSQVQQLLHTDVPQISLYADYRLLAVNTRVTSGEPKDLGMFINANEWDVQ